MCAGSDEEIDIAGSEASAASLPSTLADLDDSAVQNVRDNEEISAPAAEPVHVDPLLQIPHPAPGAPGNEPADNSATEGHNGELHASEATAPTANGHEPR